MHILIIDDDRVLVQSLFTSLQKEYAIDTAYTAEQGEYLATIGEYDAIIIDFNLPDKTGVTLCDLLRRDGCRIPIVMLTGRTDVDDKILALDGGVDDYITKPFSSSELRARLRALMRRNPMTAQNILCHGEITIDLNNRVVTKNNQKILLGRKEFDILEYLMRNRGRVVRREMLHEHIWGGEREPNTNSIETHIKQIRKKLHPNSIDKSSFIKSVYGLGYQIQ